MQQKDKRKIFFISKFSGEKPCPCRLKQHHGHEMMNNCPCPPVNAANKSKGKIQSRRGERAEPVRESLDSPVDSSSPLRIKPRSIKDQTHPAPEPHAFGKDLTRQARHPEKKKVFKQLSVPYKTPSGKKRERERGWESRRRHIPQRKWGGAGNAARLTSSSGWLSASEPAEGSDPEPAQTRILRQPFLDRAMERADRDRRRFSQSESSGQVLCSAERARVRFWSLGAEQDGSGWPLCCASACFCGGLACSLAASACAALHGVFIFLVGGLPPPRALLRFSFRSFPVRFYNLTFATLGWTRDGPFTRSRD